jgi:hypothetical protein
VEARTLECHQRNNPHTFKEDVPMAQKKFVVWIHWSDGDVTDTDEVEVVASNRPAAVIKAVSEWSETQLQEWPSCQIEEIEIPSRSRLLGFA